MSANECVDMLLIYTGNVSKNCVKLLVLNRKHFELRKNAVYVIHLDPVRNEENVVNVLASAGVKQHI